MADTPSAADRAMAAATVAARTAALAELEATSAEPLADYAAGSIRFFVALEMLGQGLHRHGFDSPSSMMVPLMRLPIPDNRRPEALDYEKFRAILMAFRDELEASAAILARVPDDAEIGLEVDLSRLGIDIDGDGGISPGYESATAIIAAIATGGQMHPDDAPDFTFRFDRADGYWLQGYANFLMAQADFWLAPRFPERFRQFFSHVLPARRSAVAGRAGSARRRRWLASRQRMAAGRSRLADPL